MLTTTMMGNLCGRVQIEDVEMDRMVWTAEIVVPGAGEEDSRGVEMRVQQLTPLLDGIRQEDDALFSVFVGEDIGSPAGPYESFPDEQLLVQIAEDRLSVEA